MITISRFRLHSRFPLSVFSSCPGPIHIMACATVLVNSYYSLHSIDNYIECQAVFVVLINLAACRQYSDLATQRVRSPKPHVQLTYKQRINSISGLTESTVVLDFSLLRCKVTAIISDQSSSDVVCYSVSTFHIEDCCAVLGNS